jgi:hypothetical protein
MSCGTFLRFGVLTTALIAGCSAASALDPNAKGSAEDPLVPTVQALAPLPSVTMRTGIPAPVVPLVSELPPGVSPKLGGPTVAGNAINASEAFRAGTRLYYEGDRKAAI